MRSRSDYTTAHDAHGTRRVSDAQVAQLVEHATENRSVGGSIPPLGTIYLIEIIEFGFCQTLGLT